MATLYAQTTQNSFSNFNWNSNNDNYAWSFVPTATGVPTQLVISLQGVTGTPTGEFYIKSDKTFASTTYGSVTGVTLTSGVNTLTLSSGAQINSGTTYWVYFRRTSNSSNYPAIQFDTGKTNYPIYRSTAINIDPATLWQTFDIKMSINGTLPATGNFFLLF